MGRRTLLHRRRLYRSFAVKQHENPCQQTGGNQTAHEDRPTVPGMRTAGKNVGAEISPFTDAAWLNASSTPLKLARRRPNCTNVSCSMNTGLNSARLSPRISLARTRSNLA